MLTIFRVEDVNGGGLYRGDYSCENPLGCEASPDRHPLPSDDSYLMRNIDFAMEQFEMHSDDGSSYTWWQTFLECEEYFFGFSSKEQFLNWIYKDEWLEQLDIKGFVLAVYEIPNHWVCLGNTQAVFKRGNAVTKRTYPFSQFFNI